VPAAQSDKSSCYQGDTHHLAVAVRARVAHFDRKLLANNAVHKWRAWRPIFDKVN
jgi:hypothetical protein